MVSERTSKQMSEVEAFYRAMIVLWPVLVALISALVLLFILACRAPDEVRSKALKEKTCAENKLAYIEDRHKGSICGFFVDNEGKRIESAK